MSKIYFTADTHYGHKNIVSGVSDWDDKKNNCRNFNTIDDMNKAIIKKINQTIDEDDILYHLGDWSFGGSVNIWNFRKQINCKNIHLILGNHDQHINDNLINLLYRNIKQFDTPLNHLPEFDDENLVSNKNLFSSVQDYLEIPDPRDKKKKIVLFHYPIEEWNGKHKEWIHLHGHSHGRAEKVDNRLDVYLDNQLKIWSMDEIIKLYGK